MKRNTTAYLCSHWLFGLLLLPLLTSCSSDAQKEADSDADRHEQNGIIDMRHRLREHLKIGLGYRHGKAEDEAVNKYHQV